MKMTYGVSLINCISKSNVLLLFLRVGDDGGLSREAETEDQELEYSQWGAVGWGQQGLALVTVAVGCSLCYTLHVF